MDQQTVTPVTATPSAVEAVTKLRQRRGPLVFYQSGGCCGGSLPMCFPQGELRIGDNDVLLGHIAGCPFYIDARQYERWKHTQLIVDVAEGEPEGFSLAAADGWHFVTRSRVFSAQERVALEQGGIP
ncbi:DUF779 domain-containing protein [Mycobacterium malmoense]|uniref:Acetaldehyde dehydrogenase n=1 Tax=Mycobacterium malmoense TaxID=1780 RepID=A0ABX3STH4_MYCMA|nr:DUF779 domain-containing protein [Mycobacterium malmoense]OIN78966.1 hypothetical protein BMG05_20830 [Mycobacterium malmoense]ORA83808.1 hypothetical protein BST29_09115 [Mycobacterium malmoense]UNB95570.1 DUF779 domain-containing protein [Mycobacterium malmoense]